jgi:hypothetical protein
MKPLLENDVTDVSIGDDASFSGQGHRRPQWIGWVAKIDATAYAGPIQTLATEGNAVLY